MIFLNVLNWKMKHILQHYLTNILNVIFFECLNLFLFEENVLKNWKFNIYAPPAVFFIKN